MTTYAVQIMIGLLTVLGIIYDVVAYALWGNAGTLSKAMQRIGEGWPIIIVVYGGLGAHFFCPRQTHWAGCWPEFKPYVLLLIGFVCFRLAWTQAAH